MVHAVAHQVHQRVANFFDHGFVKLGFFTVNVQHDVFAEVARHIMHHALEAAEGSAYAHHAQLQRAVAHLFDQGGELGG